MPKSLASSAPGIGPHTLLLLLERWAVPLVSAAAAVYILRCLPPLLVPSGLLGALLLLIAGALGGVLALAAGTVLLFLAVTREAAQAVLADAQPLPPLPEPEQAPELGSELLASLAQEMHEGSAPEAPPHAFAQGGEYCGWLWALDPALFDRSQTLVSWPPSKADGAVRYWGSLRGGTLFLARPARAAEEPRGGGARQRGAGTAAAKKAAGAPGGGAGAEGAAAADGVGALQVDAVRLTGCSVAVVMDGLAGKSRWLRKAPLELRHERRPLLDGRTALLLFAGGSAAKEQWCSALARGAAEGLDPKDSSGCAGTAVASVEALYASFCVRARELAAVSYPQESGGSEGPEGPALGEGGEPAHRRRWGRFWGRRSSDTRAAKQRPVRRGLALASSSFVSPIDIEQAWMGRRLGSLGRGPRSGRSGGSSTRSTPAGTPAATPEKPLLVASRMGVSRAHHSVSREAAAECGSPESPSPVDKSVHSGSAGVLSDGEAAPQADAQGAPGLTGAATGGAFPVSAAVNALLARAGFDLLRSAAFRERAKAHVQRKIDGLRTPGYLQA
ncbi:hypothetical protein WJX81_001292 [Elliptochloris bilobata]|uniref:SMP-LTD domain-containing protein n=1 Tax=Elliptochloris bilobata TaxID=381761 RepID=A0AAW1SA11_9CHLO